MTTLITLIIVISGIPGVGKSTVAKALSEKLNFKLLHLSSFLVEKKAYSEYDKNRKTYILDEEKAESVIRELLSTENNLVIETVYPALVSKADKVIVLRRHPLSLYEELKKRGWNELKVAENVEAEILGVVSSEAYENFSNVCEIDVTDKTIDRILEMVENYECERVDWLGDERVQSLLFELDKIISEYEDYENRE